MRGDVLKTLENNYSKKELKKVNRTLIAKKLGCTRKTVRRHIDLIMNPKNKNVKVNKSKLDSYLKTIKIKVDKQNNAVSIYEYIKEKGYTGKYGLVKKCVAKLKQTTKMEEDIFISTTKFFPGVALQVDWKEKWKVELENKTIVTIHIFVLRSQYSGAFYWEPIFDMKRETLFLSIINGLKWFEGVPETILFDNTRLVVDINRKLSRGKSVNVQFESFAKDIGFKVKTTAIRSPQQKACVETAMKFVNRLKVWNGEYKDMNHFIDKANQVREQILINENRNLKIDLVKHEKEKKFLQKMPQEIMLKQYTSIKQLRKVQNTCFINFNRMRFMVNKEYVDKVVEVQRVEGWVYIYHKEMLIKKYQLDERMSYADRQEIKKILNSDKYKSSWTDQFETVLEDYFRRLNE